MRILRLVLIVIVLIITVTPLYGKETFSWPYKTYTDNKIKMTTVFVNSNADNKTHLDRLLIKGNLQVLCENETQIIIQISLIDLEMFDDKISIWRNRTVRNIDKCTECVYRYICGGGCTYKAISKKGQINSPNCSDFEKIIKEYIRYHYCPVISQIASTV